jgi:hypothetical protein
MIASLATWLFFTMLLFLYGDWLSGRNAALMTLFLAWRHHQNFRNLFKAPEAPKGAASS